MKAPQRIVVGVDGSPASAAAVRWVADYARRAEVDVDVEAVYVVEPAVPLDFTGAGLAAVAALDPQLLHESAAATLHDVLDEHAPELAVRSHEIVLDAQNPGQALLRAAAGASMLVVGAHPHHGLGLLFGSTASGCTRHATCPVVVVPEGWRPPAPAGAPEEVLP